MPTSFEWDEQKNQENQLKHGVPFEVAQYAFAGAAAQHGADRIIYVDLDHSTPEETRYFCLGRLPSRRGQRVCTVRFTYRAQRIRIFGAGFWRKERRIYEQRNKKQ